MPKIIYEYAMVANIKCEQLYVFFKKKRQNLAKIQALPGPAPGAGPGKPEQIPTPRPETPNPDPEPRTKKEAESRRTRPRKPDVLLLIGIR
jgi:hypothetical protein